MRHLSLIAGASCLVMACSGQPDKTERLAEQCYMDQAGTRDQCACMAREAEARLDPDVFDMFLTMSTHSPGDDSEAVRKANELSRNLSPEQTQQLSEFMTAAVEVCGLRP